MTRRIYCNAGQSAKQKTPGTFKEILSRVVFLDKIAAGETGKNAKDEALRLPTPDAGIPGAAFGGDFGLKRRELAFQIGLL